MFEDRVAALNNAPAAAIPTSVVEKRVYTVEEIQDILQVSRTTAYALVKSGVFHSVRVGGQHRISKKSFDAWLDAQNTDPGSCQVCD